jgi:hypothetical protein
MISPDMVMTADSLGVISRLVAKTYNKRHGLPGCEPSQGLALLLFLSGRAGLILARPS